jgi:predicted homoserine dehydrogenase-like protein
MINVEADVLAGPLLTRKAKEAGIIYSMAYGDQPALIAEMVDWARAAGFDVVCAGKGTKHLPRYHASTPDTVWSNYGFTKEQLESGDFNPQMFNSFLDSTKSALEMAAVANGCDLSPPKDGLRFPPCGTHDLPEVLKPKYDGGQLDKKGTVEVVSCLEIDGRPVFNDLRWRVYVVIEAPGDHQKDCFKQYGLKTDSTGKYAAQYKPYHLIGLELGISIATIMVRGEPTGQCKTFSGDVVATAKKDLKAGERLDGEGGFMVYGKLMTAEDSLAIEGLPIGLAHGINLKRDVNKGQGLSWEDVEYSDKSQVIAVRREMEAIFRKEFAAAKGKINGVNGTNSVTNGFH